MSNEELRSSQVVLTFGPGAMVDFPDASVIIAGLDDWQYANDQVPLIEEPRLVAKLERVLGHERLTLRAPPSASDDPAGFHPTVTAWRFPEWFIVQKAETVHGHRRRRLINHIALDRDRYRDAGGSHEVVPVRFVRACTRGHIGDIDWKGYVHGGPSNCARDLWMEERGTTGELEHINIVCECGAVRSMSPAAALGTRALGTCTGGRPWLGPRRSEACGEPARLLIRSASNAYFPQTLSVISIPDSRSPIDSLVRALWEDFLSDVGSLDELRRVRRKPTVATRLAGLEDDAVVASIERIRRGDDGLDRPVKEVEFDALTEVREELGSDTPEGDFFARSLPCDQWDAPWMAPIERVVLVHRLREVIAQVGFTRFEAAGTDVQGELELDVKRAPLAVDANWLPAIENRGEGIFLQFRSAALNAWLGRAAVIERGQQLREGFDIWKAEHSASTREFPGAPYYLLHSFAHLLLNAIGLECGYPGSALRERVYAASGRIGVLIYTGSSDAEGTLGGLVAAGCEIRRHVQTALESASLCAHDPVCAFHRPGRHDPQPLHGSACHGCLLISETSCEQRNELLDRALVVPTVEALGCELFPAP